MVGCEVSEDRNEGQNRNVWVGGTVYSMSGSVSVYVCVFAHEFVCECVHVCAGMLFKAVLVEMLKL